MKLLYIHNNPLPKLIRKLEAFGEIEIVNEDFIDIYYVQSYAPDVVIFQEDSLDDEFISRCKDIAPLKAVKFILLTREAPQIKQGQKKLLYDIFEAPVNYKNLQKRLSTLATHLEEIKQKSSSVLLFSTKKIKEKRGFRGKRAIDIAVAVLALTILSPVFLLIAILVKLDSKGPILYKSKRVGSGYKIFDLYKFRTMRTDADKMLNTIKNQNLYRQEEAYNIAENRRNEEVVLYSDNEEVISEEAFLVKKKNSTTNFVKVIQDPRITKVGKFLRNASLDELPQLVNILVGDMSLVGNRPLPLYEAETLTSDQSVKRFLAPAGLTGLWQVTKRGKKEISAQERIQLDNEYTDNCSLWLDVKIILKTFPALLQTETV